MPLAPLPGVLQHYLVLNPAHNGKPADDLILVHGLGANLAFWYWKLAPALAASNRVVIFDLRGHGLSSMPRTGYTVQVMAEDLKAQLDFIGVTEAHFVGHSFGGRIIIHFACKHPDRVKSLTLADVVVRSVQPNVAISWEQWWPLLRHAPFKAGMHVREDAGDGAVTLLEMLARLRLGLQSVPRTSAVLVAGPFAGVGGRRSALQWLRLLEETTARDDLGRSRDPTLEQLAQWTKPTLLVYGEHSHALPTLSALKDLWPHARTDVVSKAGHFFPLGHPERLLAPVGEFIRVQHAS